MNAVYDILEAVKEEFRKIKGVNTVSFGRITDVDLDKTTIFPLSHIIMGDAFPNGNVTSFTLRIICADVVDFNNKEEDFDSFYGNDNTQDVLNTQFEVLNQFIMSLRRGDLRKANYEVADNIRLEPFMERFSNMLAGWTCELSILTPNASGLGSGGSGC